MPRWHIALLLAMIYLGFLGCATGMPIPLDMIYEKANRKDNQLTLNANQHCSVHIASIVDGRSNKETIGILGSAPIVSDHITDWISQGLMDLESYGYQISDKEPSPNMDARVLSGNVTITRVFIHQNPARLHGTVVLRANFRSREEALGERLYRGDGDRINWTSDKEELSDVLNRALKNAVSNISMDLKELCRN